MYKRFTDFYDDLLSERHNKVLAEKLYGSFMGIIMNPEDQTFKDIRQRIVDEFHDSTGDET